LTEQPKSPCPRDLEEASVELDVTTKLYPARIARLEGVIAQLGAALWKVG
jgi:hypothetical protein